VSLHVYTTEAGVYRARLAELGAVYRRHLGRHYVAAALFEVAGLFDPAAKVELVGIAVVPDPEPEEQP
jgi:enamine deaminase RidA (YjgF/YER057c/UK114 family)